MVFTLIGDNILALLPYFLHWSPSFFRLVSNKFESEKNRLQWQLQLRIEILALPVMAFYKEFPLCNSQHAFQPSSTFTVCSNKLRGTV